MDNLKNLYELAKNPYRNGFAFLSICQGYAELYLKCQEQEHELKILRELVQNQNKKLFVNTEGEK